MKVIPIDSKQRASNSGPLPTKQVTVAPPTIRLDVFGRRCYEIVPHVGRIGKRPAQVIPMPKRF
jgi:hypothetical protein